MSSQPLPTASGTSAPDAAPNHGGRGGRPVHPRRRRRHGLRVSRRRDHAGVRRPLRGPRPPSSRARAPRAGAVHAAQGYARASGRPGVCIATSGPGATNLVTGIADAQSDSTPVVCITGQVASTWLGTDAFQETDVINVTAPLTKWNVQVTRAEDIPAAIAKAFYIARSGRPGPVLVDITRRAGSAPSRTDTSRATGCAGTCRASVRARTSSRPRRASSMRRASRSSWSDRGSCSRGRRRSCSPSRSARARPSRRPSSASRPSPPTTRSTSAWSACTVGTAPTPRRTNATCSSPWGCASTTG